MEGHTEDENLSDVDEVLSKEDYKVSIDNSLSYKEIESK